MILSCSSCQARYLVPAAHFAIGPRLVRCARCNHMWVAEIPAEPAAALAEQLSALAPASAEAKPVPPGSNLPVLHKAKPFWRRRWIEILTLILAGAFILWFVFDRREIGERWPRMQLLYDRIGLHVYRLGEGLSLRQVRSEESFEGGIMQLTVNGLVHNDTRGTQTIPDILAAAKGADGKVMQSWQIDAPAATVGPGADVPFTSEIHAPNGTVVEINLHFAGIENVQ